MSGSAPGHDSVGFARVGCGGLTYPIATMSLTAVVASRLLDGEGLPGAGDAFEGILTSIGETDA